MKYSSLQWVVKADNIKNVFPFVVKLFLIAK